MKKELPVGIPVVKAYKWHAVPLSVFKGNMSSEQWVYNNYLQLVVQNYPGNPHWLDFFSIYDLHHIPRFPWIKTQNINLSLIIETKEDLRNLIIKCLENNMYLDACYDMFYLQHTFAYKQIHRASNMLIYGYDLSTEEFCVMDYLYNTSRSYDCFRVDMDNLAEAILSRDNHKGIKAIYEFDRDCLTEDQDLAYKYLEDYKNAQNSFGFIQNIQKRHINSYVDKAYGVDVYDYLFDSLRVAKQNPPSINILPFVTLHEHKQCLLGYMMSRGDLNELRANATEIEKMASLIKLKCVKYTMTHNLAIIDELEDKLHILFQTEKQLLKDIFGGY